MSKVLRNIKTFGYFTVCFYVMLIPVILGIMGYENGATGYWCTPLAILMGIIALIVAIILTPFHDFSIDSNLSEREILKSIRDDFKKGFFEKNNQKMRNFIISLTIGILFFMIMKLAVAAWDGIFIPYIGNVANSIICLISFALPALAYLIITGFRK